MTGERFEMHLLSLHSGKLGAAIALSGLPGDRDPHRAVTLSPPHTLIRLLRPARVTRRRAPVVVRRR